MFFDKFYVFLFLNISTSARRNTMKIHKEVNNFDLLSFLPGLNYQYGIFGKK